MPTQKTTRNGTSHNEICLLGQPPLHKYLDFVKYMVVGGDAMSPKALTDRWRAANDHYHTLEVRESGIADTAECHPLTAAQKKLTNKIRADHRFKRTFDTVPTAFRMIELDKLVVFQTRVDAEYVKALSKRISPRTRFAALLDFCYPLGETEPEVDAERIGARRYVFSSISTDFRFQSPVVLQPEQMRDVKTSGSIAVLAGVPIGFGSNMFSVIRSGKRMLLHNGYHRACAMRAAGITHAPCIVQTVTRQDEFEVVAKAEVAEMTDFYFRTARPPLLKDFFDPDIRRVYPVKRVKRVIEVNLDIREYSLPV